MALAAIGEAAPEQLHDQIVDTAAGLEFEGRVASTAVLATLTSGAAQAHALAATMETAGEFAWPHDFPDLMLVVDLLNDEQVETMLTLTRTAWKDRATASVAHALFRRLPMDRHPEVAEIFGTRFALFFFFGELQLRVVWPMPSLRTS